MKFSEFAKKLIVEWRKLQLPVRDNTVIIAVSGGADSVSLLAALHELQKLKKLNLKMIVAHFNHNLRPAESDADADFVRNLAQKCELEFIVGKSLSLNNRKSNLEQAARLARYNFLNRTAEEFAAFAVLTAHTLDDQAETFLLRLIRGSGADGLAAMQPKRLLKSKIQNPKSKIELVRPLLSWARRSATENYCQEKNLKFRFDSMNDDLSFARIRVRRQLLPLLKTFNPQIAETISNTANLIWGDAQELNAQAEKILNENGFLLFTACCSDFSTALRRRILRLWLKHERGTLRGITACHLKAIETLVTNKQGGRTIELPGDGTVTRQQGKLIFTCQVEKSRSDI